MRPGHGPLARLRPIAARLLLALFVASTQLVPAMHLATHRNDHTHGPGAAAHAHGDEDDTHHDPDHGRAGLAFSWIAELFAGHHHDDDGHHDDHDDDQARRGHHQSDPAEPHHDGEGRAPGDDHGDGSSAHYHLALGDAPPPPFLPPPPETIAVPPDAAVETSYPAPLPQPPARGPPVLA